MCGLAGVVCYGLPFFKQEQDLHRLSSCLKHRGPNAHSYYFISTDNFQIGLAHYRLSIIDLSEAANQPFHNEKKSCHIVFNGEIYNYIELRALLHNRGYRFRTHSDTEVLMAGYETWGIEETLQKVQGMFAFSIYDEDRKQLFLARDRFGKKPLYYHYDSVNKRICFSSDIRSFYALNIPLSMDMHALGYYFSELSTPGDRSIWREIRKVPESSWIEFSEEGLQTNSYWQLNFREDTQISSRKEILERIETLLIAAVKKRLVADVNVACLLSGGIDSSLVASIMASNSAGRIDTYSVGFEEQEYNESPFARKVAERYQTRHHEIILRPQDLSMIDQLIWEFGEPFADPSMIPTYHISRSIGKQEKVVLSGDGGDEIFGGYYIYYLARTLDRVGRFKPLFPFFRSIPPMSHRISFLHDLTDQYQKPFHRLLNRELAFDTEALHELINNEESSQAVEREHSVIWSKWGDTYTQTLTKVLACSHKTRLLNDYLVKVDRASMFASLEVRSPFLDHSLAEEAARIPGAELIKNGVPKSILKDIAKKYLPEELIYRKKQGFSIPLAQWFRSAWLTRLKDTILQPQNMVPFDYSFISRLVDEHVKGADHSGKLWTLYVFHRWINQVKNR